MRRLTTDDRLLLAARVAAGAILIGFGLSKFTRHAAEAAAFERYGLPSPSLFAYLVGIVEVAGGTLLVLGIASRLVALMLAGNMAGAIATGGRVDGGPIHLGLAPALLAVMLVIVWVGPGRWSLDRRLGSARAAARRALAPRA
jgi:putative oxidoreductase